MFKITKNLGTVTGTFATLHAANEKKNDFMGSRDFSLGAVAKYLPFVSLAKCTIDADPSDRIEYIQNVEEGIREQAQ